MTLEHIRRRDTLNPRYCFRSAITGLFLSRLYALLNPTITVRERAK